MYKKSRATFVKHISPNIYHARQIEIVESRQAKSHGRLACLYNPNKIAGSLQDTSPGDRSQFPQRNLTSIPQSDTIMVRQVIPVFPLSSVSADIGKAFVQAYESSDCIESVEGARNADVWRNQAMAVHWSHMEAISPAALRLCYYLGNSNPLDSLVSSWEANIPHCV